MAIPSLQIEAFLALARQGSFSRAAKALHVTQSALSQRIAALESGLEQTFFLRDRNGAKLTNSGQEFLRFAQAREAMEEEALQALSKRGGSGYSGVIRIGLYSSIARSVVLPSLAPFLRANPSVECSFLCRSMNELPQLLARAEADIIILDRIWERESIERRHLGEEKYVLIEAVDAKARPLTFLDNDSDDLATEIFFSHQKEKAPAYRRAFHHDCYGIIDAVSAGLGTAVMSRHLLRGRKGIRISKSYRPVNFPVTLHFYRQAFTTKLQNAVIAQLERHCPHFLEK